MDYLKQVIRSVSLFSLIFYMDVSNAQESLVSTEFGDLITISPSDLFANQQRLLDTYPPKPIPLHLYSKVELSYQRKVNDLASETLLSFAANDDGFTKSKIDDLEITPYTWKWVDLDVKNSDGTTSKINLRRPNSWLAEQKAESVGNQFFLDIPEMGISGWATVRSIRVNLLDTRFLNSDNSPNFTNRPITGKFEHTSRDIYQLVFEHGVIEATGTHPFWSMDRDQWVVAKDLQIGEKVKTYRGKTPLVSLTKKEGWYTVYNLEVYKDHTYIISSSKVVVHNACIGNRSVKDIVKSNILPAKGQLTVDRKFIEKTATRMEEMIKNDKYVDWAEITANASDGPIQAVQYSDGTIVIINGRHRVIAAELVGVEIPWYNPKVAELRTLNYTFEEGGSYAGSWDKVQWGTGKTFEIIRRKKKE